MQISKDKVAESKLHAMQHGRGAAADPLAWKRPGRGHRAKEEFMTGWFGDDKNITKVEQGTGGVAGTRVLNRHRGYQSYVRSATAAGKPFYSEVHFYNSKEQQNFTDQGYEAGLCPNCERYGVQVMDALEEAVKLTLVRSQR